MTRKTMEVQPDSLWPGFIEIYPAREYKYNAVYRDKEQACASYRQAEEWIQEQQKNDKVYIGGRRRRV